MGIKNRGFIAVVLGICWLILAGETLAAEFSAQVVTIYQGQESRGKVYVKGSRIRQEFPSGSGVKTVIYNADTKIAWMLRPERKMYLEMPLGEEMPRDLMQMSAEKAGMNPLGSETVNGYDTDKYETVFRENGGEQKHYVWIAKKLGMIIKINSLDQSFSREYREIKEGGIPDALFLPPPGYQKMGLP